MAKFELKLPKMGESVAEATITNWLKNVGDSIAADEAVLEIATDKVDSEIPSEVCKNDECTPCDTLQRGRRYGPLRPDEQRFALPFGRSRPIDTVQEPVNRPVVGHVTLLGVWGQPL